LTTGGSDLKVYRNQKLGCQLLLGLSVAVGTGLPSGLLCLVVLLQLLVMKRMKTERKEGRKKSKEETQKKSWKRRASHM
jgi:hypothetical protein